MPLAICKERVVVPVDTIRLERSNDVVTVELPNGMEVRIGFCDQLPDEPRVFVMPGQGTACGIPETFIPLDEHESAVKVPLFAQEEPLRVPEPLAGMLRKTAATTLRRQGPGPSPSDEGNPDATTGPSEGNHHADAGRVRRVRVVRL